MKPYLPNVTNRFPVSSVHHARFPVADEKVIDEGLEERMGLAQDISSLILSLRKKVNIKVRQPLQRALIPVLDPRLKNQIQKVEELIRNEVNVKKIEYLSETEGFIKKKIKPNYVALGKKLGAKMKAVTNALVSFSQEDIGKLEKEGFYSLPINGEDLILQLADVEITSEDVPGWTVASKGALTVALDITVTPELILEGNARELVNRIQKIRKESGFELTDRIQVIISEAKELKETITQFNAYICAEILADKLDIDPGLDSGNEIEVNDIQLKILVTKKA